MGYVLPVNHYQYNDYKRRVIKEKQDPFHIEKPYKTILRTEYGDLHKHRFDARQSDSTSLKLSTPTPPTYDKLFAEVTGKGRHFSSIV